MAGDEQFLSWDLADVLAGKPPRSTAWQGPSGLAALKSGQGSINLPMLRLAVQLRAGNPAEQAAAVAAWKDLLQFFQGQWMGSELGSRIYGVWHMLAVASVLDWAQPATSAAPIPAGSPPAGDPDLAALARGWLLHWWCLMKLVEAPDGRLLLVGMRSGGHAPDPGFLEWVWALATDGPVDLWEAKAKELHLGLRQNWIYSAALALKEVLRASAAPVLRAGQDVAALTALLPRYGLIEPYHILKAEGGLAVWIEHNRNGNTTPVAGAVWTPESLGWLPENGGRRIREKLEDVFCRPVDGKLVYDSNFQGHQELALPGGKTVAEISLPLGTPAVDGTPTTPEGPSSTPTPPSTPTTPTGQPDSTPPPASPRPAAALADDVLKLAVPKRQVPLRDQLAGEVSNLPAGRPPAEIAADLGTLGISQGQLALWHQLEKEVAAFGQATGDSRPANPAAGPPTAPDTGGAKPK